VGFGETWHSDWSFLPSPPQATVLYGNVIPPVGGDTLFADQVAAWEALPAAMRTLLKDKLGIHSARRGHARDGMDGERDKGRSMAIRYDAARWPRRRTRSRVCIRKPAAPRFSSARATPSASKA
jgi:alpha-ketoglutarate-dependent taurine dioxygenase